MKHTLKILGAGITILIDLAILRIQDPYPIEVLRLKGLDYYQRTQDKVKSENIVVVEIDEQSLDTLGQWPWPRQELAEGIKKAFENEAAVVVLPIIFAEKDRLGGDEKFIDTLKKAPIITSQSASIKGKGVPVPRGVAVIGPDINEWLFDYPNAIGPVKEIGESSAGVGMLLTAPELDGVTRRLPLIITVKKETYPTLPLEVLRVFGNEQSYQAKVSEAGLQAVRVKGTPPVNTDANGRATLTIPNNTSSITFEALGSGGYFSDLAGTGGYLAGYFDSNTISSYIGQTITVQVGKLNAGVPQDKNTASFIAKLPGTMFVVAGSGGNGADVMTGSAGSGGGGLSNFDGITGIANGTDAFDSTSGGKGGSSTGGAGGTVVVVGANGNPGTISFSTSSGGNSVFSGPSGEYISGAGGAG